MISSTNEAMDHNKVTTYSLLAHINNSDAGMKDFSDVFLPLVKSAIAKLSNRGITKGASLMEIKKEVDTIYQLDIPFPLIRKLVNKIASDENRKEAQFILYSDGAFEIKDFTFADYNGVLDKQETEIEALDEAYFSFLQLNGIEPDSQISIFDFLDQNRASLSQYFASATKDKCVDSAVKERYANQADFITSIKNIPAQYDVLKKVYLGSVIAGYLEIAVEDIKHEVEFVLDTNFITGLLDLSSDSSHHTCKKIIEICKRFKYRITVLDITLREAKSLIEGIAESLESSFLQRRLDPESIPNACGRRKLNKTDLQSIASNLTTALVELGVNIIPHTTAYEKEARQSKDYTYFSQFRNTHFSALHDATGVTYVKKKRIRPVHSFYNANCWFVTNTPHQQTYSTSNGSISEIIRAEDLINILWLSSPSIPNVEMLEVGLTRLISSAYSDSLPSARVLKELDDNIRKYANGKVAPRDLHRVASAIANKTIVNLDEINQLAKTSDAEFIAKLKDVAAEVEAEELELRNRADDFLRYNQQIADKRVIDREAELKEKHKKEIEEIASNSFLHHSRELIKQSIETKVDKKENYDRLLVLFDKSFDKAKFQANSLAKLVYWIVVILGIFALIGLWYYINRIPDIEKFGVRVQLISPFLIALWAFFSSTLVKYLGIASMKQHLESYFLSKAYEQYDYDEQEHEKMKLKKRSVEEEITRLQAELIA